MSKLETRTYFDSNRLSGHTQRLFHAAWCEVQGHQAWIVPTVARELAREGENTQDLEDRLQAQGNLSTAKDIRASLWWTREWKNPQGCFARAQLDPPAQLRKDLLLEAIEAEGRPSHDPLAADADAHIICEVLALGGRMLMTRNLLSIDHEQVNEWVRENHGRFGLATDRVIYDADEETVWQSLTPTGADRTLAAALGCVWREHENDAHTLAHRLTHYCHALGDAELPQTATWIDETVRRHIREGTWAEAVHKARAHQPVQARTAEERRAGWTGWRDFPRETAPAWRNRYALAAEHLDKIHEAWRKNPDREPNLKMDTNTEGLLREAKIGRALAQRVLKQAARSVRIARNVQTHDPSASTYLMGQARTELETALIGLEQAGHPGLWYPNPNTERNRVEELKALRERATAIPQWIEAIEEHARHNPQGRHALAVEEHGTWVVWNTDEDIRKVSPIADAKEYYEGLVIAGHTVPADVPVLELDLEHALAEERARVLARSR